jgi:hypothetical protein
VKNGSILQNIKMSQGNKLRESFQLMIDWNLYRLKQNNESLSRLEKLLSKLDRDYADNEIYAKDIVDLDSLKIIYETSIRNFDAQIEKYKRLIADM